VLVFAIGANTANTLGGNFEIDAPPNGSNFVVDLPSPSIDWATEDLDYSAQGDAPTGQGDDSYKGGVKEDTACPAEVTGSIPNNKSDLKDFPLLHGVGRRRAGLAQPGLDPGERPIWHDADGLRAQPGNGALRARTERGPHGR
jgi:hypothetical protein